MSLPLERLPLEVTKFNIAVFILAQINSADHILQNGHYFTETLD